MRRFLFFAPRVLGSLLVLLLFMLSFDVFSEGTTFTDIVVGLLIHNIPTFFMAFVLLYSFKHPRQGGLGFIFMGLSYSVFMMTRGMEPLVTFTMSLTLAGPAILTGILFMLSTKFLEP